MIFAERPTGYSQGTHFRTNSSNLQRCSTVFPHFRSDKVLRLCGRKRAELVQGDKSLAFPVSHLSFIIHNRLKLQDPSRRRVLEKFDPNSGKFLQSMPSRCGHERDISLILFVERCR